MFSVFLENSGNTSYNDGMGSRDKGFYSLIIVDDEKPIREGLEKFPWENLGFSCIGTAMNANQALALATQTQPDVVLSDIKMPGLTGIDLAAALHSTTPHTKVVLISGYKDFEYARRAIKESVFEYILKPIDQKQLEQVFKQLRTCLDEARAEQENPIHLTNERGSMMASRETDATAPAALAITIALNHIDKNYSAVIGLEDISALVGLNPTYFSERFKHIVGMNYIDYVKTIRMENAKKLLGHSRYKVQEVAVRVGYADPKYFTLVFKRYTGMNPQDYRQSLLEQE